jgi:SAM-dependent methyltransferase
MDVQHLAAIRGNVEALMKRVATTHVPEGKCRLLDVAPQVHAGARPHFPARVEVETFDIDPKSGCTYIGDICRKNPQIPDASYDIIICTEVLEHVLQPFGAVAEIERILKPGGIMAVSTPFNFRIHGPLPDCWRFTIHGLRALFADFEILSLDALETPDRDLMPIHYTLIARKPA